MPPPSAGTRVSVMRPASSIARSGRLTLLCSRSVVMTWSPVCSTPLNAMLRASVQLSVKTNRSGLLAVEEAVEPVPAVVEGVLGGQGHLVPGPAGVGELRPGEAVEGLVDGLRLGETGGGVVEVVVMASELARCSDRRRRSADDFAVEFSAIDIAGVDRLASRYAGDLPACGVGVHFDPTVTAD